MDKGERRAGYVNHVKNALGESRARKTAQPIAGDSWTRYRYKLSSTLANGERIRITFVEDYPENNAIVRLDANVSVSDELGLALRSASNWEWNYQNNSGQTVAVYAMIFSTQKGAATLTKL